MYCWQVCRSRFHKDGDNKASTQQESLGAEWANTGKTKLLALKQLRNEVRCG